MVLKNVSHVGVVLAKRFESGSCIEGAASQEVFDGLVLELTFRAGFGDCLMYFVQVVVKSSLSSYKLDRYSIIIPVIEQLFDMFYVLFVIF